jgi:hypothetical protein
MEVIMMMMMMMIIIIIIIITSIIDQGPILGRARFSFLQKISGYLRPTKPPMGARESFLGVKRPGLEALLHVVPRTSSGEEADSYSVGSLSKSIIINLQILHKTLQLI